MAPQDQLIVALDFPSATQAIQLVDRLEGAVRWAKVGLELYLQEGRTVVEALQKRNLRVFLDLKLHDIPNTVASAVRVAGNTGAALLTIHGSGGSAMMAAAAEAAPPSLRLLAVTVLTSMDADALHGVGVAGEPEEQVCRLGELAAASGINGLVCSAQEITALRSSAAQESLLVVPGIRPTDAAMDDQRRVATPARAIEMGADMLVVGRPITRAADPAAAALRVLEEIRLASGTA